MAKTKPQEPENTGIAEYNWDQFEGSTGLENLSQQDLGIPMLIIVQKGSAEFDTDHPEHEAKAIEGVKVGDIINTVSRQILFTTGGNPIKVVPYFYKLVYLEWKPKEKGGGIVATHTNPAILNQCTRDEQTGKDVLPNGNNIVTTAYYFVRILEDGKEPEDALIAFTSTQLKKSRIWLNMMRNYTKPNGDTLPMYHRPYFLSTVGESNQKGTWRGWKLEAGPTPLADPTLIQSLIKVAEASRSNTGNLIGAGTPPEDAEIC